MATIVEERTQTDPIAELEAVRARNSAETSRIDAEKRRRVGEAAANGALTMGASEYQALKTEAANAASAPSPEAPVGAQ